MGKFKNLTGQKFGKLTVKYINGKDKHGNILWVCQCDCINKTISIVRSKDLNCGAIKSCGCINKEWMEKLRIINTKYEKCKIENCNKKHYGLGYCSNHWQEYKKYGKIRNEEERKITRKRPRKKKIQYCEICNKIEKSFYNKKTGMILCGKHAAQFFIHGKFLDKTRFNDNEIIIKDDIAEIALYDVVGNIIAKAIIDINQLQFIKNYKWHKNGEGYAQTTIDNKKIRLHRFLINATEDMYVDHKNRRRLDCRLSNLRLCTQTENNRNVGLKKSSKSKIRGIYQDKYGKWIAYININKKKIHLGYFINLNDAIKARIDAENKYFKEFAPNLNDEVNYE